ncbi:glycosyl hydrolase family 95 catalytic domain-containing protein [Compostimonas suwonensis]|uniref:glycosyl hydrolase family 95 catalytic domain-containing protein n=1 Tax=Compostimonas suwonensis TaxID=1048394 RepID=UPI000C230A3E|nr:hypothetical protein [Compostimonas suwonensis]
MSACPFPPSRADHVAASTALHERFSLRLRAADELRDTPTVVPEVLGRARRGDADTRLLVELFVNYCRYLLASSSRPGTLPSNLQGIWNAQRWPNWESDFHPNINLQLNYWPADPMGLPECVEPLADWLETARRNGEITARETYAVENGWTMNHISNAWGFTAPGAGVFGIWPMGGAWMTISLYDHYLFTQDIDFLRERVYPLMKGAAEFFFDFLVEAPAGSPVAGRLVTVPSNSPENSFRDRDGAEAFITYGATMDSMIVSDLFTSTIDALTVLRRQQPDLDLGLDERLAATRARLVPVRISPTTGGIQEWAEDYEEVDPGHRHVSPLYDAFPRRRISYAKSPELAAAAARTIARKFASGYEEEGWSLGWIAAIFARLEDGDGALDCVERLLRHLLFQNLFVEAHMHPQVGDMQGVPTAVLEMLAFGDVDRIELLPALPAAWPEGEVRGLRLRGNRELTMSWRESRLLRAEIVHHSTGARPEILVKTDGDYTITHVGGTTTIAP